MGLITKEDVRQSVIKLHQSGKKYPLEYEKTKACRTVDEINSLYKTFVIQLTNSIWDYFTVAKITLPSKEAWERATFIAMAENGEISAQLMLNALKICRQAETSEIIREEEDDSYKPLRLTDDERLCNAMIGKFSRLWGKEYNLLYYDDYPVNNNEVECEMDRLGLPIAKAGYKRLVVWAGLKLRKFYQDKNISESDVDEDGNYRLYTKKTLTVFRGVPILWGLMPDGFYEKLDVKSKKEMLSKLA